MKQHLPHGGRLRVARENKNISSLMTQRRLCIDDSQICASNLTSPLNLTWTNWLLNCLLDIPLWVPNRHLYLNVSATELRPPSSNLLHPPYHLSKGICSSCWSAQNLGFMHDAPISLTFHIQDLRSTSWLYLQNTCRTPAFLSTSAIPPWSQDYFLSRIRAS